jgi:hypothetical protein
VDWCDYPVRSGHRPALASLVHGMDHPVVPLTEQSQDHVSQVSPEASPPDPCGVARSTMGPGTVTGQPTAIHNMVTRTGPFCYHGNMPLVRTQRHMGVWAAMGSRTCEDAR